jgi:hypothetical protein
MFNKSTAVGLLALLAAPSIASAQGASLHGFADLSAMNDYITPRGLVVTSKGTTLHVLDGLVVDVPLDPKSVVSDIAFVAGTWMDWNPGYDTLRNKEAFNEFDWFVGANAKVGQDWKIGATYGEFISPQQAFVTEKNLEFNVNFDDSRYLKALSVQPYVKVFYAISGDSTVVVGKRGGTFDVEIGGSPSLDLHKAGLPVVLSAPTWITLGPSSFWGGGSTGVFSTGLKATVPLSSVPAAAGHWAVYGAYQYYDLINDRLVLAEKLLNGKSSRDLSLFSIGLNLGF